VGELIADLTQDLSTLMRQELELAKAEVTQEAVKSGRAASLLGGAGLAGYTFLLFLSLALAVGLGQVMHVARAMLIVAGIWALAAALLYSAGRRQLRQVHPKPQRTVDTLKEVPDAMRGR
jgi:nitrate/nitrite transporter NarK